MAKKVWKRISYVLIALAVAFALLMFVATINFRVRYGIYICQQYSMVPTFNSYLYINGYEYTDSSTGQNNQPGDYIILDKKDNDFNRGDIVSAHVIWSVTAGQPTEEHVVKRLIGLPGDKIYIEREEQMEDGEKTIVYNLYVNDEILYSKPEYEYIGTNDDGEEIYLNNETTYNNFLYYIYTQNLNLPLIDEPKNYIELGEGEYFILGDNWESSYDCMDEGEPISLDEIEYKVEAVIPYNSNVRWQRFLYTIKLLFVR